MFGDFKNFRILLISCDINMLVAKLIIEIFPKVQIIFSINFMFYQFITKTFVTRIARQMFVK